MWNFADQVAGAPADEGEHDSMQSDDGGPGLGRGRKAVKRPSDPAVIDAMLAEQIGFWFSDANLRKDKFLLREAGPLGDGPVALASIATFNRVKALTADIDVVRRAVTTRHDELALSEDGMEVRRRRPLPTHDDSEERTVRVDGLKAGCSHSALRAAFGPSGTIAYVSLPRHPSGDAKGHGLIEFTEAEGVCAAVAALEGATGGAAAALLPEGVAGAALRVTHKPAHDTYRGELEAALAEGASADEAKAQATATAREEYESFASQTAAEAEQRVIVHVLGLPKSAPIKPTRRAIKEAFEKTGELDYVDYGITDSGNPTVAFVRMTSAAAAAAAVAALGASGFELAGQRVRLELLRGDALITYLAKMTEQRARTAEVRKAKRDQWWQRKYGGGEASAAAAAGGEDAATAEEEEADTDAAAPPSKRRKAPDGEEGRPL